MDVLPHAHDSRDREKRKKAKGGTVTQKKYRFASFTQRIERLDINPIRRRQQPGLDALRADVSNSYFVDALQRWRDVNLAAQFTEFQAEILSCSTLAQVVHFAPDIFDLLLARIRSADKNSLEPFLDLLAQLAHDLGATFNVLEAVRCVAGLEHTDVAVIEWSFNCLAWLFKYFSRHLILEDLSPLYTIMAPYLGREDRKHHISRFAAEALSFLVRKAAVHDRLDNFMAAMANDIANHHHEASNHQISEGYRNGLAMLMLNSIIGVGYKLHSHGLLIYESLVKTVRNAGDKSAGLMDVLSRTTIALVHRTDADGLAPVFGFTFGSIVKLEKVQPETTLNDRAISERVLFLLCATRKGSRVTSWPEVSKASLQLLECCTHSGTPMSDVLLTLSIVIKSAPISVLAKDLGSIVNAILALDRGQTFLVFCRYVGDWCPDRFRDFLAPYFSSFMAENWQNHTPRLLQIIPQLCAASSGHYLTCPEGMEEYILQLFSNEDQAELDVVLCSQALLAVERLRVSDLFTKKLYVHLDKSIKACLTTRSTNSTKRFFLGQALIFHVSQPSFSVKDAGEMWSDVCRQSASLSALPSFLVAISQITQISDLECHSNEVKMLGASMIHNLCSEASDLRTHTLSILVQLTRQRNPDLEDALAIMKQIEQLPKTFEHARKMSMLIRRLPETYRRLVADPDLKRSVPYFCFGILTYKLAPARGDVIVALEEICTDDEGLKITCDLVCDWLKSSVIHPSNYPEDHTQRQRTITYRADEQELNCPNVRLLEAKARKVASDFTDVDKMVNANFEDSVKMGQNAPTDLRMHALDLLLGFPSLAQQESAGFVPHFLAWAGPCRLLTAKRIENVEDELVGGDEDQSWSLGARKAMLKIMAQFKKPQKMLRADDVFQALIDLLSNGDKVIQIEALKAIFAWKKPDLIPYHETLLKLLDDAQMRDELINLVESVKPDQIIEPDRNRLLISVTTKLLYGKMISKEGRSAGKSDQEAKRKAILHTLARLGQDFIGEFVSVAVGRLLKVELVVSEGLNRQVLDRVEIAPRQQLGMLKVIKALLEILGGRLESHVGNLIKAPLYTLSTLAQQNAIQPSEDLDASTDGVSTLTIKSLRALSFGCLQLMAHRFHPQAMSPFISTIFSEALSPRLQKLAVENSQAVSGVLRLFSAWAASPLSISFLVDYDHRVLPSVADCLTPTSCKEEVKLFVMNEILAPLLSTLDSMEHATIPQASRISSRTLKLKTIELLSERTLLNLHLLLKSTSEKNLLEAGINLLKMIASEAGHSPQALPVVDVSSALLKKPPRMVNPRLKGDILRILTRFLPMAKSSLDKDSSDRIYETLSNLFGYFKDRENRLLLSEAFCCFTQDDRMLQEAADLCQKLNAFSARKAGEPDFEARMQAYNTITDSLHRTLSATQWRPILENALFYFKDEIEMMIRANSVLTFKKFVDAVALARKDPKDMLPQLLDETFFPKIRRGAHEESELIRSEYVNAFAYVVQFDTQCSGVRELQPLLVGNDEEASFFSNILHIQQHRRIRAVRRLAYFASEHNLGAINVSQFFMPLLEHFVFDTTDADVASSLAQECITAIGSLARSLAWPQFRAILARYCSYLDHKLDHIKSVMRLLGVMADTLRVCASGSASDTVDHTQVKGDTPVLCTTLPAAAALSHELSTNVLSKMMRHVHHKDESVVSLRVPVSVTVVKLLKVLPEADLQRMLPPLLTDLCNILRSKAQDSRDLTRRTLGEIARLIGPSYFGFIFQELRSALTRGSQLHVLSFTVHSILLELSQTLQNGDIDPHLSQITSMAIEDLIGKIGQEKDAEEYVSKMREVKNSKAYDTIEIISRLCSVSSALHILKPIRLSLDSKLDLRALRKFDELFRHLEIGLALNEQAVDQRILVLAYEVLKNASSSHTSGSRHLVSTQRHKHSNRGVESETIATRIGPSPIYRHKISRFAFNLVRAILRKSKHLKTSVNLSGWVPILSEALMTEDEAQIPALRLILDIIDLPIPAFESSTGIYIAECMKLIKNAASTDVEASQAAYKLVAALLRDKTSNEIRVGDVAYMLKRLVPELEQPERQGGAFNFVRAVMSRKIMVPEIYEIHDEVARIMVTNHAKTARDAARATYVHFILNYPQTRDRFTKQIAFLVENLDYKYVEGRQSVMEALHLFFSKAPHDFAQKAMQQSHLALMMILINDESAQCREMSSLLLRTIVLKADPSLKDNFVSMLRKWLESSTDSLMQRAALQAFALVLEASSDPGKEHVKFLQPKVLSLLRTSNADSSNADWELVFYALQIISKLCDTCPDQVLNRDQGELWIEIRNCLLFHHTWIHSLAAKLLGILYSDIAKSLHKSEPISLPLTSIRGLQLDEQDIQTAIEAYTDLIESARSSPDLIDQSVRNLLFLGNMLRRAGAATDQTPDRLASPHANEPSDTKTGLTELQDGEVASEEQSAFVALIVRLSRILREPPASNDQQSLQPLKASLQLIGAFVTRMKLPVLRSCVVPILIPLHGLTDTNIPRPFSTNVAFTEDYGSITANASELMSKLQEKLGTTEYLRVLHQVRERAKQKREARRTKRAIDRVAYPERAGREKMRKNEKKRERRKEKQSDFRAARRGW